MLYGSIYIHLERTKIICFHKYIMHVISLVQVEKWLYIQNFMIMFTSMEEGKGNEIVEVDIGDFNLIWQMFVKMQRTFFSIFIFIC